MFGKSTQEDDAAKGNDCGGGHAKQRIDVDADEAVALDPFDSGGVRPRSTAVARRPGLIPTGRRKGINSPVSGR